MLQLSAIDFRYNGKPILQNVNLQLNKGEVVALMGPSGMGKSTLLQIAAGWLQPNNGAVNNTSKQLGYLWQARQLLSWRNALDNAALGLELQSLPPAIAQMRARKYLTALGLENAAQLYPSQLSGGMCRRVALAQILAIEPDLLLLDEPLTGLDLPVALQCAEVIRGYAAEHQAAVLVVTHGMEEALAVADKILLLDGTPAMIQQEMPVNGNSVKSYNALRQMILGGRDAEILQCAC